jgi:hypothetical protein
MDLGDDTVDLITFQKKRVKIPSEYDYYVVELSPDKYQLLVSELKQLNVRKEIIQLLAFNKAIKDEIEYRWDSKDIL